MEQKNTWHDTLRYNSLHYKKKKDGKHEFGIDLEAVIPSAEEIRMLGNKNRQCKFY